MGQRSLVNECQKCPSFEMLLFKIQLQINSKIISQDTFDDLNFVNS